MDKQAKPFLKLNLSPEDTALFKKILAKLKGVNISPRVTGAYKEFDQLVQQLVGELSGNSLPAEATRFVAERAADRVGGNIIDLSEIVDLDKEGKVLHEMPEEQRDFIKLAAAIVVLRELRGAEK
jgi:hypothetical protein